MDLAAILSALDDHYLDAQARAPAGPPSSDPFELVLWENVAYLLDDSKRLKAFDALRQQVGLTPEAIADASEQALFAVAKLGGMEPERRVATWRLIASIALQLGDLAAVARQPFKTARRAFQKFPSLGEPGAEKVLLFCGAHATLPLESNGLRVLVRLGFGEEARSYSTTYRSVRAALGPLPADSRWLIHAHQQLRRHGQELCRRTAPDCAPCPLRPTCAYYRTQR